MKKVGCFLRLMLFILLPWLPSFGQTLDPAALGSTQEFIDRTVQLRKESNWRQLEVICRERLNAEPMDAWALCRLSTAMSWQKKKEESFNTLKRAIEIQPREIIFWINIGSDYFVRNDIKELQNTILMAEQCPRQTPEYQIDIIKLKTFELVLKKPSNLGNGLMELIKKAETINYAIAKKELSLTKGLALLDLGRSPEAVIALRIACDNNPHDSEAHKFLVLALCAQGIKEGENYVQLDALENYKLIDANAEQELEKISPGIVRAIKNSGKITIQKGDQNIINNGDNIPIGTIILSLVQIFLLVYIIIQRGK